jgi:hypothetical protein
MCGHGEPVSFTDKRETVNDTSGPDETLLQEPPLPTICENAEDLPGGDHTHPIAQGLRHRVGHDDEHNEAAESPTAAFARPWNHR